MKEKTTELKKAILGVNVIKPQQKERLAVLCLSLPPTFRFETSKLARANFTQTAANLRGD